MAPYILTKRNSIHIIDPKETLKGLLVAKRFLTQVVAGGKDVLFVGTKRQARRAIEDNVREAEMHFVTDRWLGGMLTNFRTIRSRLARLESLEQLDAEGLLAQQSKKEEARLRREMRKICRNLDGVRKMDKLPGVVFVVDVHREVIALREAHKLKIPTVGLIDTDSDPDTVDIAIPGNDDAMRVIELVIQEMCGAVELGKIQFTDKAATKPVEQPARRRSRRSVMARAEEKPAAPVPAKPQAQPETAPAEQAAPAEPVAPALTEPATPAPAEPAAPEAPVTPPAAPAAPEAPATAPEPPAGDADKPADA